MPNDPCAAQAAEVESNDAVLGRNAVDHPGVPVVEVRGEVIHEDHRYAAIDPQLPVDESSSADGDGLRRRVLVRRAAPEGARCAQMTCGIVPGGRLPAMISSLCRPIGLLCVMTLTRRSPICKQIGIRQSNDVAHGQGGDAPGGRGARTRILNAASEPFYFEEINATGVGRIGSKA